MKQSSPPPAAAEPRRGNPSPQRQNVVAATESEPQHTTLAPIPESAGGDRLSDPGRRQMPTAPAQDKDGTNETARLVTQGIEAATRERVNRGDPDPQGPDTSRLA